MSNQFTIQFSVTPDHCERSSFDTCNNISNSINLRGDYDVVSLTIPTCCYIYFDIPWP